jgi:hypothetical protein
MSTSRIRPSAPHLLFSLDQSAPESLQTAVVLLQFYTDITVDRVIHLLLGIMKALH